MLRRRLGISEIMRDMIKNTLFIIAALLFTAACFIHGFNPPLGYFIYLCALGLGIIGALLLAHAYYIKRP